MKARSRHQFREPRADKNLTLEEVFGFEIDRRISYRVLVIDDSFDSQHPKIFEIKFSNQLSDHVHADAFLIRTFGVLLPQAEKLINVPL